MCNAYTKNSTKHIATLLTGHIGYIEFPITNEKPKYYHVNDIKTLIHYVTHTYRPEITKIVPQTNYCLHCKDDTAPFHQFSLHQVYLTKSEKPHGTSSLCNVQLTSRTSKPRIFPHYHPLLKISNLLLNSIFSFLISQTLSILHFAIFYLNIEHVKQPIKIMLARLQFPFLSDLNPMHNLLHNVLPKYQFIIETKSILFLKY